MLTIDEASNVIEGILFLSPSPVKADDLANNLLIDISLVEEAIKKLSARHESGGLEILKTAGGYEFATRRDYIDHLRSFFGKMDRTKLSRAALEALSIVAYKQPVTRADLEAIRGVNSSGVLHSLLDWGLISISGKAEGIGRPYLFSTTAELLRFMGLDSLDDLPPLETFSKKF